MPQGLNGCIERNARISMTAVVFAGQNAADSAGAHPASIPYHLAPVHADMAHSFTSFSLNQDAQVRVGKDDARPRQCLDHFGWPDLLEKGFCDRPGFVSV